MIVTFIKRRPSSSKKQKKDQYIIYRQGRQDDKHDPYPNPNTSAMRGKQRTTEGQQKITTTKPLTLLLTKTSYFLVDLFCTLTPCFFK